MKQIFPIVLLTLATFSLQRAQAQAINTMNEDFQSNCPLGAHHPDGWADYNPMASTIPWGQWACTSTEGRGGTKGIKCTGLWGSPMEYHLDTAFLLSPMLNLSSYAGKPVYLRFDSKTSNVHLGAKMDVVAVFDSVQSGYIGNLDQLLTPLFSNDDSTDWVTHQFDLTGFITASDFYIGFRYTSPATSGSVWFLDNILITSAPLSITNNQLPTSTLSLNASGNSATGEVKVAFNAPDAGDYNVAIYDLTGRKVISEQISARKGEATYVFHNVFVAPGVYIVRAGNSLSLGTAKFIIE
jgi:hypothetical protein